MPSKSVAAFDDLNRKQAENYVFGNDKSDALHFDVTLSNLLKSNESKYSAFSDWDSSYISVYSEDVKSVDKFNHDSQYRQNMYNPMYYLFNYYKGFKTSKPAKYWQINTGIEQGDTALTVEANLALALKNYKDVKNVDFTTVWSQGHTTAERSGTSTDNFIN